MRRISSVDKINVLNVSSTSVIEIGDSNQINSSTRILAMQREKAIYMGEEHDFVDYEVFQRPIPLPTVHENVEMLSIHRSPLLSVGYLEVTSVAASSVLHIGSTDRIQNEARTKHIRHLLD